MFDLVEAFEAVFADGDGEVGELAVHHQRLVTNVGGCRAFIGKEKAFGLAAIATT